MTYTVLRAKELQEDILQNLKTQVVGMEKPPKLCVILVGENLASLTYIRGKRKACESVGMDFEVRRFDVSITETELLSEIDRINRDASISGCIVQLPLPTHIQPNKVIDAIDANKDVDGFAKENIGKLFLGRNDGLLSCTPKGIMQLLEYYGVDPSGKNVVVVGQSAIVGRPLSLLLVNAGATVTMCHSKTANLAEHTRKAEILVVAIGKAKFITADMIREGAYVIDVGINRNPETGTICGDVDFDEVIKKAHCSPVPGGVGPMTIAALLENTFAAALMHR